MTIASILIFLFILKSGGVLGLAYSEYITGIIIFITALLIKKVNIKIFLKLIFSITFIYIIFMINHSFSTYTYKMYILFFYTSVCAAYFIGNKELFVDVLEKVLFFIVIHSFVNQIIVLFHLYVFTLPFVSMYNELGVSPGVMSLYNIFGYYQPESTFKGIFGLPRNSGLFWEPGVLQIYLNLYLFVKLFFKKEQLDKYSLLGVLAVIITQSTTGLIIMSIILFVKYFKPNKKNIFFLIFFLIFFSIFIYPSIYDKLFGESTISGLVRLSHAYIAFKVFMDNFFFGYGFKFYAEGVYTNLYQFYMYDLLSVLNIPVSIIDEVIRRKISSAHDYFKIGAVFGVFIFLIFNYGWYNIGKQFSNNGWLFLLIMILFTSTSPVGTSPFSVFLVMYGFGIFINKINYRKVKEYKNIKEIHLE